MLFNRNNFRFGLISSIAPTPSPIILYYAPFALLRPWLLLCKQLLLTTLLLMLILYSFFVVVLFGINVSVTCSVVIYFIHIYTYTFTSGRWGPSNVAIFCRNQMFGIDVASTAFCYPCYFGQKGQPDWKQYCKITSQIPVLHKSQNIYLLFFNVFFYNMYMM